MEAEEAGEAETKGEGWWMQRSRRTFDEDAGAEKRHIWEHVAVPPARDEVYRVARAATMSLRLAYVVEVALDAREDGEKVALHVQLTTRRDIRGWGVSVYPGTPAEEADGGQLCVRDSDGGRHAGGPWLGSDQIRPEIGSGPIGLDRTRSNPIQA